MTRTSSAAAGLLAAYAIVRTYWELGHMPREMSPVDTDLVAFTGWSAVVLCVVAAGFAVGILLRPVRGPVRQLLVFGGTAASIALVASGALLLLDVIGLVLPGVGIEFFPRGALSRVTCVGSGILLAAATLTYRRETRGACLVCGRTDGSSGPLSTTPMWAYCAAYVAVAGCVVRVLAQAVVGFGDSPLSGNVTVLVFEGGFVLAGTLLPLALVHGWGRTWPRWVPFLGIRRIPRWLVLGPAMGISAGIVIYFGLMLAQMVVERLQGRNPFPPSGGLDLPEIFFWFAVPAYFVWGCGMAVAAGVYFLRTRTRCRHCGR